MKKEVEKFNKTLSFLEELLQNKFIEKEVGIAELGLNLFIERTVCGLRSSQVLLNNFHADFDHGLGLIFRCIISDFFLIMNMIGRSKSNIDEMLVDYFKDGEKKMDSLILCRLPKFSTG